MEGEVSKDDDASVIIRFCGEKSIRFLTEEYVINTETKKQDKEKCIYVPLRKKNK